MSNVCSATVVMQAVDVCVVPIHCFGVGLVLFHVGLCVSSICVLRSVGGINMVEKQDGVNAT